MHLAHLASGPLWLHAVCAFLYVMGCHIHRVSSLRLARGACVILGCCCALLPLLSAAALKAHMPLHTCAHPIYTPNCEQHRDNAKKQQADTACHRIGRIDKRADKTSAADTEGQTRATKPKCTGTQHTQQTRRFVCISNDHHSSTSHHPTSALITIYQPHIIMRMSISHDHWHYLSHPSHH